MAFHDEAPLLLRINTARGGHMGGECDEAENQRWPPWLKPLLATSFFGQCKMHADAHKCECNMYCLDCVNGALCSQCLAYHHGHHAIQRPQPRPGKGVTNTCDVCERSLLDTFRFCSLGCKIVGTSGEFRGRKRHAGGKKMKLKLKKAAASDSDDSSTITSGGSDKSSVVQSFSPSTPPATANSYRSAKRRKGIPHRSPFGSLIVEF
uniref:B box-type domain-containing protein n=1 Tax=Aegilops tauschii subsp. strangulata TaxID=200361 RepID=A0A453CWH0_AEGTS